MLCEIAPERAGGSWVKENRDWTLVAEGMRIPVFFYAVDQFGDHSGVGDQAACFPGPGRPAQYASFGPVFRDVHSISTWGISCSHPFLHFSVQCVALSFFLLWGGAGRKPLTLIIAPAVGRTRRRTRPWPT